jgi:hypothetical protein
MSSSIACCRRGRNVLQHGYCAVARDDGEYLLGCMRICSVAFLSLVTPLLHSVLKLAANVLLAVLTAMVGQVQYACICSGGSSSDSSSSSRAYVQLGEELVQSGESTVLVNVFAAAAVLCTRANNASC